MKTLALPLVFKSINLKTLFSLFGCILFALNTTIAQTNPATASTNEITVKGLVVNEDGPLPGVNILLKGTKSGTVTDFEGTFTFPIKLKANDVLVFQYIGYTTQEITVKADSSFLKIELTPDLVEILGALDVDKPYKSKRKKKN
jgi:hypothetical protein